MNEYPPRVRKYIDIDDIVIPESFHGDPDDYAVEVAQEINDNIEVEAVFCFLSDVTVLPFKTVKRPDEGTDSRFTTLPRSMFFNISTFLTLGDLGRLSCVSRDFAKELKHEAYWHSRYFKLHGKQKYEEIVEKALTLSGPPVKDLLIKQLTDVKTNKIDDPLKAFKIRKTAWTSTVRTRQ